MAITYTGRLGAICNRVLTLFNDTQMQFVKQQSDLLTLVNLCKDDLEQHRYYKADALLDVTAGTADIDLAEELPTLDTIKAIFWVSTGQTLVHIDELETVERLRLLTGVTQPYGYVVDGSTLTLVPEPAATETGALRVFYYYRPADITGSTAAAAVGDPDNPTGPPAYVPAIPDGTTPEKVPAGRDAVFVWFALWHLFGRDRHAPKAAQFAQQYMALYERARANLLEMNHRPGLRMRRYR